MTHLNPFPSSTDSSPASDVHVVRFSLTNEMRDRLTQETLKALPSGEYVPSTAVFRQVEKGLVNRMRKVVEDHFPAQIIECMKGGMGSDYAGNEVYAVENVVDPGHPRCQQLIEAISAGLQAHMMGHDHIVHNSIPRKNRPDDKGAAGWHLDNPPRMTVLAGVTNEAQAPTLFANIAGAANDLSESLRNLIRPVFIRQRDRKPGYICFPELSELEGVPSAETVKKLAEASQLSEQEVRNISAAWNAALRKHMIPCVVPAGGMAVFPNCGQVFHRAGPGNILAEKGPDAITRLMVQTKEDENMAPKGR